MVVQVLGPRLGGVVRRLRDVLRRLPEGLAARSTSQASGTRASSRVPRTATTRSSRSRTWRSAETGPWSPSASPRRAAGSRGASSGRSAARWRCWFNGRRGHREDHLPLRVACGPAPGSPTAATARSRSARRTAGTRAIDPDLILEGAPEGCDARFLVLDTYGWENWLDCEPPPPCKRQSETCKCGYNLVEFELDYWVERRDDAPLPAGTREVGHGRTRRLHARVHRRSSGTARRPAGGNYVTLKSVKLVQKGRVRRPVAGEAPRPRL